MNTFRFKQMLKAILYDALINYSSTTYRLINNPDSYKLIRRLVDEDHTDIKHFNAVMKKYNRPIEYFSKVMK